MYNCVPTLSNQRSPTAGADGGVAPIVTLPPVPPPPPPPPPTEMPPPPAVVSARSTAVMLPERAAPLPPERVSLFIGRRGSKVLLFIAASERGWSERRKAAPECPSD